MSPETHIVAGKQAARRTKAEGRGRVSESGDAILLRIRRFRRQGRAHSIEQTAQDTRVSARETEWRSRWRQEDVRCGQSRHFVAHLDWPLVPGVERSLSSAPKAVTTSAPAARKAVRPWLPDNNPVP